MRLNFDVKTAEVEIGGKKIIMETGRMAKQANGAVLLTCGETMVLATAVASKAPKEGIDFFPLTVEYIEKLYSAGKIPGGFIKREARPPVASTLTSRLIDRPLRPLFPDGYKNDVQIVLTVISYDGINSPDWLGIVGASAALTVSNIPFMGPAAGVTVGYVDGQYVINPSPELMKNSLIDLKVAGSKDAITMVEAGAAEVSEELMLGAIMFGHDNIKTLCAAQEELQKTAGKTKNVFVKEEIAAEIKELITDSDVERLKAAILLHGKQERQDATDALEEEILARVDAKYGDDVPAGMVKGIKNYYEELIYKIVRNVILFNHHRADGRKLNEIRPIDIQIDVLPSPHGSALFSRGETQALVVTTLGTGEDEQMIDGLDEESRQKFYLHYNFPPFSVGETGRMGTPGRRELGHGALAERALRYVLPDEAKFPYTIRIVSEILESNGSSSMASVCGGSLALMATGVPIKSHVSGVAMGLIKEGDDYVILTDIQGLEDHLGDMDFKVAGTRRGITALQMDIKITGINEEIMRNSLAQANEGRMYLLGRMEEIIEVPRVEMAEKVPRLKVMTISKDKIAELIGPSGKNIKAIIEKTGAKIDIEDTGNVTIFAENLEKLEATIRLIEVHTKDAVINQTYMGKVKKLTAFGAFMEIMPGREGLLHVSEIAHERVKNVEDVIKMDQEFEVKVIGIDEKGKINLSRKALLEKPEVKEMPKE